MIVKSVADVMLLRIVGVVWTSVAARELEIQTLQQVTKIISAGAGATLLPRLATRPSNEPSRRLRKVLRMS